MTDRHWAGSSSEVLVELLSSLSELLSMKSTNDMPDWIALPGKQWPLYQLAIKQAMRDNSEAWIQAIHMLSKLPAGSRRSRWQDFQNLLSGKNGAILWLHESKYRDGRVPGPTTFQVQALYKQAGLEIVGAELADHASLELAFLAYLIEQEIKNDSAKESWGLARELFIRKHVQLWMPSVGQLLVHAHNPAWQALGYVLIALFEVQPIQPKDSNLDRAHPAIKSPKECTLCGFCVQVCPSKALQIIEDEKTTALWLKTDFCIRCNKCEQICPEKTITLDGLYTKEEVVNLRESPRALCKSCHQPMVSQAELDFTAARLDHPAWLAFCPDCRSISMENKL